MTPTIQKAMRPSRLPKPFVKCRAFRRHNLDGHVYQESRPWHGRVWVAYLECEDCGTERVDVMEPETCELLYRKYPDHPPGYDTSLSAADAKKQLFRLRLID